MDKTQFAIELLRQKYAELGHLPKRDDFDSMTVCLIKQKLGPWPRALEKAGLKEAPPLSSAEKNRIKRERIRKNCKRRKKENMSENPEKMPSEKMEE